VDELLKAGADPNRIDSEFGRSCLLEAARLGHPDIVFLLLKNGALCHTTDKTNNTPLHFAILQDNKTMIESLISAYMGQKNMSGDSAISIAEAHGVLLRGKKEGNAVACKVPNCRHVLCLPKKFDSD